MKENKDYCCHAVVVVSATQRGKRSIPLKTIPYQSKQKNVTIASDNFQVKCTSIFVRFGLSPRLQTPSPANLTNEYPVSPCSRSLG